MKKQLLLRGLLGFPLGIAISYVITISISVAIGKGSYFPCVPALVETAGSEIGAVILQTALGGFVGSLFAMSSLIWEIDNWSLAKQTGIYFAVTALGMTPIAYFANWMEHSVTGFLLYFATFVGIFIVVWTIMYLFWKAKIRRMNEKVENR